MKLLTQTRDGAEGNCLATCVAMLFDVEIEQAPNLDDERLWWAELIAWSRARGLRPIYVRAKDNPDLLTWLDVDQVYIAGGPAVRGFDHAVLYRNGGLFWDPHPSGAGLIELESAIFFVAVHTHDQARSA